jgi:hypothetical protein
MSFLLRWALTFLAFPLGGFLVLPLVPIDDPLTAALASVVTGAVVGLAQWWALRRIVTWRWAAATAAAMVTGSTLATLLVGGPTSVWAVAAAGLISGALVGAAQGILLRRGPRIAVVWTAVVSASWSLGWVVTAGVISSVETGFAIFGASGAAVVTLITGVALAVILRLRGADAGPATVRPVPAASVR